MSQHRIRKGLDLPITGQPQQVVDDAAEPSHVAVVASDFVGLKPTMRISVGDSVRKGQTLFVHKRIEGVRFTAPASGTISAIERGPKRVLESVVIRRDSGDDSVGFAAFTHRHPSSLDAQDVRALLLESGLWTALRTRPYGRIADPATTPASIFVTAWDSEPGAPDLDVVAEGREDDLERGLTVLTRLAKRVFLCRHLGSRIGERHPEGVAVEDFSGPHPAGTPGLHIHTLDPVHRGKTVWYLGLQDLLAIGVVFATGELDSRRIISISGPAAARPRLLRTRVGASIADLCKNEINGEARLISGSVLSGRAVDDHRAFLGPYDQQISALPEGGERPFLGWLGPGFDRFSVSRAFLSAFMPKKSYAMNTASQGDHRAIVPIGQYERVFPFDLMPSFLLKSLVIGDVERAEELGVLELEEQDVALCTFACPGKIDYGPHLRTVLDILEKEG